MGSRGRKTAIVILILFLPVAAFPSGPPAGIRVFADSTLGGVNPLVFGQNVEAADPFMIFGPNHGYVQSRTGDGLWDPVRRGPASGVPVLARDIGMKMLRYPGGCLAHNFKWQDAAGPVEKRPNFTFGLDEFVAFCRATGAEPLVTVSDYVASPEDAAGLVEYLNAPADGAKSADGFGVRRASLAAGRNPWARRRAEAGHPEPYGVKYFELGNESDHGNHDVKPFRKYTAEEYAGWFNGCAKRMRAVDPGILLGALMGTGTGPGDPWNAIVLTAVKTAVDFIVVHTYAVGIWSPESVAGEPAGVLMRACMASGEQFEALLGEYRTLIRERCGRDIPLAITEYNASFVQDKPVPYRFSLGAALFSADYVRILLEPGTNVMMANYWHFINGYWGMVQGPRLPEERQRAWKRMPAYYLYRLWGSHFGSTLVRVTVDSPRVEFTGLPGHVLPSHGDRYVPVKPVSGNLVTVLKPARGPGYRIKAVKDVLTAELSGYTGEQYPLIGTVRGPEGCDYRISFEARSKGEMGKARLGLSLVDSRGWDQTRSGIAVEGIEGAVDWKRFEGEFKVLPDCPGVSAAWRILSPNGKITGKVELRALEVTAVTRESYPAYAALTATASLSKDGKKLFLIVFNKHHADAIAAMVNVAGFPARSVRRWTVTGPQLEATNLDGELVREIESGAKMDPAAGGSFRHVFPARSMTAIEFSR